MKTKIAIIHFLPIELFPPTINLLNEIQRNKQLTAYVYSVKNHVTDQIVEIHGLRLKRYPTPSEQNINIIKKSIRHFKFIFGVLYALISFKPDKILYYESFSALPVFLYVFFSNRNVELLIHCHEYYSKDWYKKQTIQLRLNYYLEKSFLYKYSSWISQTNKHRKTLFLGDVSIIEPNKVLVMPNYPPRSWESQIQKSNNPSDKIKFLYIGTLSVKYTFIKELCEWIKNDNRFQLDIFGYNCDNQARNYLQQLNAPNIVFNNQGIEYVKIPSILGNYDIGLILYKALTMNFKYNATNKLFEYLAGDLEVWFPNEMLGCYDYINETTHPRILKIDFKNLNDLEFASLKKDNLDFKPIHYWSEEAFEQIMNRLLDVNK